MPRIERILTHALIDVAPRFAVRDIRCETVWVTMRDGVRLATDLYLPPLERAPAVAVRTPYGRADDKYVSVCLSLTRRGYVVIAQDCRGTGESEPDHWEYYVHESADSYDLVDWVSQQPWFEGFLGAFGGSYVGQTQWCMAAHPRMSAIVPEMSGLGVAGNPAHLYMFFNVYARSVGKGTDKLAVHPVDLERQMLEETLSGGYFNEPLYPRFSPALLARFPALASLPPAQAQRWLWERYCEMSGAERSQFIKEALDADRVSVLEVESLTSIFGNHIAHDAHALPQSTPQQLSRLVQAPALLITGWYDWALNDALATWALLRRDAQGATQSCSRLIITPAAHGAPGYHEGADRHPELRHNHRAPHHIGLLLHWYASIAEDRADDWPAVIYYLMGANEWRVDVDWPPPSARAMTLYLGPHGQLSTAQPVELSTPDRYTYDPRAPSPTMGGSIVSNVYPPGSVDVSAAQQRADVLTYTSSPLVRELDVVGPLRAVLYVSSSAPDTDFVARISDVFPDGRAIQLQSGLLRARFRHGLSAPDFLQPGHVHRLEIDLWATANRFQCGHRIRIDISSADFPRFDRHANRAGDPGDPVPALQTIFHDPNYPSHVVLSLLEPSGPLGEHDNTYFQ